MTFYLSFNVESPTSTSIMVVIQNRILAFGVGVTSARGSYESPPQRQYRAVHLHSYLNFKVESPTKTSIIVMIQNRTTTCVSFQPLSS